MSEYATLVPSGETRGNQISSPSTNIRRAPLGRPMNMASPAAPPKGSKAYDRSSDYYWRTLSTNAIAGVARLPQVSMPLGQVDGTPVGLSLLAGHGRDLELLATATRVAEQLRGFPVQLQ